MPAYVYKCENCGEIWDEFRSVSDRNAPCSCHKCKGHGFRDVMASIRPHTETGFSSEQLSDALGVHPEQIAEAKAKFPGHRFHPDGRMIFGSAGEKKRVMKDLGFHDLNSYY